MVKIVGNLKPEVRSSRRVSLEPLRRQSVQPGLNILVEPRHLAEGDDRPLRSWPRW